MRPLLVLALLLLLAVAAAAQEAGAGGGRAAVVYASSGVDSEGDSNEQVIDNANDDGTGTTVVLSNQNNVHALNSKYAVQEEMSKQRMKQEAAAKKKETDALAASQERRAKQEGAELDARAKAAEARLKASTSRTRASLEAREKKAAQESAAKAAKAKAAHERRAARARALAARRASEHRLRTELLKKAHAGMAAAGESGHLPLSSGWRAYGGGWQKPRGYLFGRLAVLEGLLRGTSVSGLVLRIKPQLRPAGGRLIFQQLHGNVPARVDVLPDGRVYLVKTGRGSAWLSLDGIAYDVRGGDASPALLSNWRAFGSGYRTPRQTRLGDVCMLSGLVRAGEWRKLVLQISGAGSQAACMPKRRVIFSGPHHNGVQRLDLLPSPRGGLQHVPAAKVQHGWVSLDGLSWPTGYGRPVHLGKLWTNYGRGYARAAYAKAAGDSVCMLTGLVRYTRGRWHHHHRAIARLPVGCRPRGRVVAAANAHEQQVRLDILPNGYVLWITRSRHSWVSLAGIKFVAYQ